MQNGLGYLNRWLSGPKVLLQLILRFSITMTCRATWSKGSYAQLRPPARIETCDVPDRLSRWQWVDLDTLEAFNRLCRALETHRVV